MAPQPTIVLRIADLELDPVRHRAARAGRPLQIGARAFAVLHFLMRRAGRTVTRAEIISHIWGATYAGAHTIVDGHIRELRLAIDEPFPHRLIHTVRGQGYRLQA